MAREITATAGGTSRVVYGYSRTWPLTMACWVRFSTHTDSYPVPFSICGTTSSEALNFYQEYSGFNYSIIWGSYNASQDFIIGPGPDYPPNDRWYALVGRLLAGDSQKFDYYDPVLGTKYSGTDTANLISLSLDTTALGNVYDTGWGQSLDGAWAEAAIWDVALSDDEVLSYLYGVAPSLIRPSALTFYVPGIRGNGDDLIGGVSGTETGTITNAEHPPGIIYPSPPQAGVIDIGDRTLYEWTAQDMAPGVVPATMDLRNNHPTVEFDDTVEEYIELTGVMPRKADLDYLGLKLVWTSSTTSGATVWKAQVQRVIGG